MFWAGGDTEVRGGLGTPWVAAYSSSRFLVTVKLRAKNDAAALALAFFWPLSLGVYLTHCDAPQRRAIGAQSRDMPLL